MSDRLAVFRDQLDGLARDGRTRALTARGGVDFASNDYLGLAGSPRLAAAVVRAIEDGASVGATGSRLLRGNDPWQERLEAEAATFFGAEAAIGFGGGYVANVALLSTLPQTGDLILIDALSHASTKEGARMSRAEVQTFAHSDVTAASDAIAGWRAAGGMGAVWICVESLYSMDGDKAPLRDLADLADRDGFLVIDEAHATGVFGPQGRGLGHAFEGKDNVLSLHTFGKALGGQGGLICCAAVLRDFMVNRARPLIFATAPSPLMAAAGLEALAILREEPWRQQKLAELIDLAGVLMAEHLPHLTPSGSQIVPLIVGRNEDAMALAGKVQACGYDVRGIRPPTVPEGTARLRLSLTLNATRSDVEGLIAVLGASWPDL